VIASDGETVTFIVSQLFQTDGPLEMLSVEYRDSVMSSDCDTQENVKYDEDKKYEAVCFDGHAEVSLYISVGDDFDADECEKCGAPAEDSTNVHAFHFQFPCVPICATEFPRIDPDIATDDICLDDIQLVGTVGATDPDLPIEILEQTGDTVTFQIINPFDEPLSIYTQIDENKNDECMAETNVQPWKEPITYTATCYDAVPLTIVDIFYTDSSSFDKKTNNAEIPECCDAGDNPAIQYTFKLYCESQCGPVDIGEPADAPTDIRFDPPTCEADVQLFATGGSTEYPDLPISILEQNGDTVTFEVINPFDDAASIYTQLDENKNDECMAETHVKPLGAPMIYTATCYDAVPLTIVDIFFTDLSSLNGFLDKAEIPECCDAGDNPAVQYVFKIYCESQCGPGDRRLSPEEEMVAINEILKKYEREKKTYLRSRKDFFF